MVPRRRKSIHHDETLNNKEDIPHECEVCSNHFLVKEDGTQTKLNKGNLGEWLELQKEKENPLTLSDAVGFQCKECNVLSSPEIPAKKRQLKIVPKALKPKRTFSRKFLISLTVIICMPIIITFYFSNLLWEMEKRLYMWQKSQEIPSNPFHQTDKEIAFDKDLSILEKVYTNQVEDTWATMEAGVKSVVKKNPNEPSVFLLLYDSESSGKTAQCIAQDVSKHAIKFLLNKSKKPVVRYGAELDKQYLLEDPGLLLKDLNNTLRENGALVVVNLQKVPPTVATSFHFVCDKYSPLVERAVLFFTLKVDKVPDWKHQSAAQESLEKLWSELEGNLLQPLITRMTPNVVSINPDSSNC